MIVVVINVVTGSACDCLGAPKKLEEIFLLTALIPPIVVNQTHPLRSCCAFRFSSSIYCWRSET